MTTCPRPQRLLIQRNDIANELMNAGWAMLELPVFNRGVGSQSISVTKLPKHPISGEEFDPRKPQPYHRDSLARAKEMLSAGAFVSHHESHIYVTYADHADPLWAEMKAACAKRWLIFVSENVEIFGTRRATQNGYVLFESDEDAVLCRMKGLL